MNKKVVRGLDFYTMADGGFFGDPGDSPEAYSPSSFSGPSGPEAAAGGPDPFDRPPSSSGTKTSVNIADFIGSGDEDEDQDIAQDVAIAYSKPEEERSWVEKNLIEQYEDDPANIGMVQTDDTGRITGYTSPAKIPGILTGLASLFGRPMVYTGFGTNPFAPPDTSSDDRLAERARQAAIQQAAPVAAAPELTPAESAYFARGVGTGTAFDLTDPEDIKRYLASLYAPTPSPFGRETSAYGLRKKEKRMRGLDIFKPVSIV